MAKQITLSQLRQASEKAKQYVDAQATAQVIRTETVLYTSTTGDTLNQILTLNDDMTNYDTLVFHFGMGTDLTSRSNSEEVSASEFANGRIVSYCQLINASYLVSEAIQHTTNTTIKVVAMDKTSAWASTATGVYKITGIKYTVPETYSTSEQIVGTWIDGRPLYQKTMTFTATSLVNDWQVFPHNIANVDVILFDGQKINPTNGETYDVNYYHTTGSDTFWTASTVGKTNVYFKASTNQAGQTLIYTLKYTKTT